MSRLLWLFLLTSAFCILPSCTANTAVSHGKNTSLDAANLEEMTQKMTDAILREPYIRSALADKGKIGMDTDTARRLFTLITVLHWKG